MARTARGQEVVSRAREALKQARTVEEFRQAQAVILPLEFGFPLEQVAIVTGISKGWVCQLRNRFIRLAGAPDPEKRKPGGRRHANMSKEEETASLYEAVFHKFLQQCRQFTPRHRFKFNGKLYLLDATVIDLCLSVLPWATFRKTKGAIKLHLGLDGDGDLPDSLTSQTANVIKSSGQKCKPPQVSTIHK